MRLCSLPGGKRNMFSFIVNLLPLIAILSLASCQDLHSLVEERRFIFNRIFVPYQVTLLPEDTHYLLTKLQEVHEESEALGIKLIRGNDQVEKAMIDFLLAAGQLSEDNCSEDVIEERYSFAKRMEKYSNIPAYMEHFNEKQLDFCRHLAPSN